MSATNFVSAAVHGEKPLQTDEILTSVKEDINVINSSLHYVNDLLRNMLDMHKASSGQLLIKLSAANLLQDILEPVSTMLYQRKFNFAIEVDCSENLVIMTDRIRLKQIFLNLANNSCKFVDEGFVRIGAYVGDDGNVHCFVEDSGPGIPASKRGNLWKNIPAVVRFIEPGNGI